ncbi:hypothetical protein HDU97_000387 [Phlyctochytrium planicorne]|nr:hypothetical protein HDU97_000387 [Phlyctochytrium planicorne]
MGHINSPSAIASLVSKHTVFVHKDACASASAYGLPLSKAATITSINSTASGKIKDWFGRGLVLVRGQ